MCRSQASSARTPSPRRRFCGRSALASECRTSRRSSPAASSSASPSRVLAKRPQLLLCDEPTGALDYQTGKQILALLQKQSRENGMTVVIITHNSALTAMADRVIRVKSGQIIGVQRNEAPVPVESIEW